MPLRRTRQMKKPDDLTEEDLVRRLLTSKLKAKADENGLEMKDSDLAELVDNGCESCGPIITLVIESHVDTVMMYEADDDGDD